jgi:hypothetical protein
MHFGFILFNTIMHYNHYAFCKLCILKIMHFDTIMHFIIMHYEIMHFATHAFQEPMSPMSFPINVSSYLLFASVLPPPLESRLRFRPGQRANSCQTKH